MDISYKDDNLRTLCNELKTAKKELGAQTAKKLRQRIDELEACANLEDAMSLPGHPHQLKHDRDEQFAISLAGGSRLVFVVDHDPVPRNDDFGIKRRAVTRIQVIFVGDYHD